MRIWPSKRNHQALPLPMHEMAGTPNRNARADRHKKRQPLLLFGGGSRSDPETWMPNMDAVRATIKFAMAIGRLDREVQKPTTHSSNHPLFLPLPRITYHAPSCPAGLALVAEDRTLNTWRDELQAHLLLTTHETSQTYV